MASGTLYSLLLNFVISINTNHEDRSEEIKNLMQVRKTTRTLKRNHELKRANDAKRTQKTICDYSPTHLKTKSYNFFVIRVIRV